ncbi:MAG: hypothetical protein LBN21_04990 [Treponema sp.]|jgi:hypothetical protein|nr:hypothetical protein [Treponema sp.]
MYRSSKIFVLAVFFIVLSLPGLSLYGESIEPFIMPSARASALGGNHTALSDDFYALFSNPAAFVGVEDTYSVSELTLSLNGPVFEILDLVLSDDPLSHLSGVLGKRGFSAGVDVGGPVSVGWVGRGLGLGLFDRVRVDASVTGTNIRPLVSGEIFLVGGYSFRIVNKSSHILDAGFLGKGFYRGSMDLSMPLLSIADEGAFDDILGTKPFATALGLGFDLGIKYTFAENLTAALVCFDAYSPALLTKYPSLDAFVDKTDSSGDYATVQPRLDLGLKYRIRSQFLDKYLSNFLILVDYQDFLDLFSLIPRNPILKVGIGVEVELLSVLSLRIGIADALPSAGFGIKLSFMELDCAIHGKELGLDPGVQSVYAVDLGLLFRY